MKTYIILLIAFLPAACGGPATEQHSETEETTIAELDPGVTARRTIGENKSTVRLDLSTINQTKPYISEYVWYELGEGPPVVMIASLGREASDFNELAEAVAAAGYKAILVQPPGVDDAVSTKPEPDLFDLAADIGYAVREQDEPVVILGHAFGNRVARTFATAYPDKVRGVILIAAGGKRPIEPRALEALRASFSPDLNNEERREAVRYGFFADASEIPDYWMRGWHGKTALLQGEATHNTESETWWAGGNGPMLVIAGMEDTIAPPGDTIDLLEAEFPGRVTAVRIEGVGHALLPEKPDEISAAIISWLDGLED